MVLVTKYRHPVLTGAVKEVVYQTIRAIFDEKGLVILEMNGETDHVHILYEADPFTSPGELVNIVKTKTSRFARKQYGDLKKILLETAVLIRQLLCHNSQRKCPVPCAGLYSKSVKQVWHSPTPMRCMAPMDVVLC